VGFQKFTGFLVMTPAAVAAGTLFQVGGDGQAAEFDRLGDSFLDGILHCMQFFLRVEEAGGHGIFQQRLAFGFKVGYLRRFERPALLLFFLQRLAFAHQRLILAARAVVGQKSVDALADGGHFRLGDSDFLTSARSIPTWVCGLAFLSANLGALELVGMAASGAKYGIATCHFLLARRHSGHGLSRGLHDAVLLRLESALRSGISQAALRRADPRFNSMTFAVMTVFASGISMNALAQLLHSPARVELRLQPL
jgi:hypothetical protein